MVMELLLIMRLDLAVDFVIQSGLSMAPLIQALFLHSNVKSGQVYVSNLILIVICSGVVAQQECSSLYNAIQTHNQQMANANPTQSISTFTALLSALGFDEARIDQLGAISSTILIPNDQAFATFVEEAAGPNADPVSFIMTQPDAFKQACFP